MDRETIARLMQRQPFEPFELHVSSGETYRVRHPELAVLGKAKIIIVDPETDTVDIVGLLHVTRVRTMQPV